MAAIDIITRYFPQLTPEQIEHFTQLDTLYRDWNAKINVISRKDIDALYEHHILHSLGIAQMIRFKPGTHILDFGTGGGFPGIPLAILFPECEFLLVDSIGKKVKVAAAVAEALALKNVRTLHGRGEDVKEQFDFVVSRAVMRLDELVGAVALVGVQGLHERVGEGADVTGGDPGLTRQDDGGVQSDDVVARADHVLPPLALDVLLGLDAQRPVVPGRAGSAVDLAAGEDEAAPLGEVDDGVEA